MRRIAIALAAALAAAAPASGQSLDAAVDQFLTDVASAWFSAPVVLGAVMRQNARSADFSQSRIDELDEAWRSEVTSGGSPLTEGVLTGAAADYLRDQVEESGGLVTEIIAMDARGLNAAASAATSDYWQGDEAKFLETFPRGPDATHVGQVEYDDSSMRYQLQVSRTITDAAGRPVGAMTIGLDLDALL